MRGNLTACDKALVEGRPRAERMGSRSTALGRGRRSRPARKRLRREQGLGLALNPQRQVHALLAHVDFKAMCHRQVNLPN